MTRAELTVSECEALQTLARAASWPPIAVVEKLIRAGLVLDNGALTKAGKLTLKADR